MGTSYELFIYEHWGDGASVPLCKCRVADRIGGLLKALAVVKENVDFSLTFFLNFL